PTTPSRRSMTTIPYRELLTTDTPQKSLTKGFRRGSGRNNAGRITVRHKGGGHKRRFRGIDFKMDKLNVPGTIKSVEYDPNRTGFIALVSYRDGDKRYILAPKSVIVGQQIITSENAPLTPANRLLLKNVPLGTFVYNVEIKPMGGAKMIRSAGNYAEVIAQDGAYSLLKMPSTEIRRVHAMAWASVGEVSNTDHHLEVLGKAGRSRWLGVRPTVRGSAMNPVDHPHGGGEGRQGRGLRRAKSKWGKPTGKGQKSRTPKKYSNRLIVSRRRVGKKK
ncbi:MAG: 50S ribosomal protein L2, partial [bacterium]|nr:50S ribosomal protein L2 [bacterium]